MNKINKLIILFIFSAAVGFFGSVAFAQETEQPEPAAETQFVKEQQPQILYFKLNRGAFQASEACRVLRGKWVKIKTKSSKFKCINTPSHVEARVSVAQDGVVKMIVFSFHGHRGDQLFATALKSFKKKYSDIHTEEGSTFVFSNKKWSAFFSTPTSGKNTHTIWLYDPNFIINQ